MARQAAQKLQDEKKAGSGDTAMDTDLPVLEADTAAARTTAPAESPERQELTKKLIALDSAISKLEPISDLPGIGALLAQRREEKQETQRVLRAQRPAAVQIKIAAEAH